MKDIEDRLRAAFEHQAASLSEESLRPAEPPGDSDHGQPTRWGALPHGRWVWPAIAAASVAALTVGVAVVHSGSDTDVRPVGPAPTTSTHPSPTDTPPTQGGPEQLSERGRRYDVGNVFSSTRVWDQPGERPEVVLLLHRWRVYNRAETRLIPDRKIAQHGFTPYAHTDQIETRLGRATYAIPAGHDATFIINECAGDAGGVPTRVEAHRVTAAQFLHRFERVATVVELDNRGWLISAQTDGGC